MKKTTRFFIGISLLLMVGVYILPFLLTYKHINVEPLPLDFSSDIYLYLNYALLHPSSDGFVLNPWYHILVPTDQLTYLKFGLLNLFSSLNTLLDHHLALTLIVWNALWSIITALIAFLLFKRIGATDDFLPILFGTTLLFFFQVSALPTYLQGWFHFPGVEFFSATLLPLHRTFFPQIAIPLLLLYLYFLIDAFETSKFSDWFILFIVQFVAFVNFPYNTALMGITTLFYIVFLFFAKQRVPWFAIAIFVIGVIAVDLFYLLHGHAPYSDTKQPASITQFNIFSIKKILGGTSIVLFSLSILILWIPEKNKFVKFALAALGFGLFLLLFSDIFIKSRVQLTHHFFYFANSVISVLLFYTIVKFSIYFKKYAQAFFMTGTLFLFSTGTLIAYAQARTHLPENKENGYIIESLRKIKPTENDLFIAPAINVNDIATWLPLVFPSEVLFSRNSEFILPNDQKEQKIYWKREALYLYLQGMNSKKLHYILFKQSNDNFIKHIIMVGQRFDLESYERSTLLKNVFNRISYWLETFEKKPEELKKFFSKYTRIIIIKDQRTAKFKPLPSFQSIGTIKQSNSFNIEIYKIKK